MMINNPQIIPQNDQPERSWHADPSFQPDPRKKIQRVAAVGSDLDTLLRAYALCPVPDHDIVRVDLVYNPSLEKAFQARLDLLESQHNNPAFRPHWDQESNADWRGKVLNLFHQLCAPYTDPDFPNVHLIPAWHGCSHAVLNAILEGGYEALGTTDAGFFGKARYFTPDAEYASRVYAKGEGGALLMNWLSCGSVYPVVGGDMPARPGDPQPNGDMPHLYARPHIKTTMCILLL